MTLCFLDSSRDFLQRCFVVVFFNYFTSICVFLNQDRYKEVMWKLGCIFFLFDSFDSLKGQFHSFFIFAYTDTHTHTQREREQCMLKDYFSFIF